MMRARPGLLVMLAGASLSLIGCGGSTPRDINFGKDAGADYTPPDLASPVDAGAAGAAGTIDASGTAGAAGSTSVDAGAGGAAGTGGVAGTDGAVSDGAEG